MVHLIKTVFLIFIFLMVIPLFGLCFENEIHMLFYVVGTYAFGCGVVIIFLKNEYHIPKKDRIQNLKK